MTKHETLSGKHALVTGGGSGIGLAIAEALIGAGASVTITGRQRDVLKDQATRIGAEYAVMDVTSTEAVDDAISALPALDICVANAGIAEGAPIAKTSDELWRQIMATNLDGAFRTMRAALRHLDKSRYGRVIAVSSTAGLRGLKGAGAYTASKHGMIGLIRALSEEYMGGQLTFNALCPGYVDTAIVTRNTQAISARTGLSPAAAQKAMTDTNRHRRLIAPQEVAEAALWLCSPGAGSVNGQCIEIAGGQM